MALMETARALHIGRSIEVYWQVERDGDGQNTSRKPSHEWKWFKAKAMDISYVSTRESQTLQATLRYETSADLDEISCKVNFLSTEELKDNDSGKLFLYRLPVEGSDESDDESSQCRLPSGESSDEGYHCSKCRINNRRQVSTPEICPISRWRQTLSRPQHLAAERRTASLVSKIQDLERKVLSHELLIHRHIAKRRDMSLEQDNVSAPLLRVPPILFLAAKTLELLERTPPPPSKVSQSSKNAHKKLPHQNWFEADAECTFEDFDKIRMFISQHKNGDVAFRPAFDELPDDIRPEYEVVFHNFRTLLWVLGARSNQVVDNILLKVRYDRTRTAHAQEGQDSHQDKVSVGIDLFGCLLQDPENSSNPTYIIIGEGQNMLHTQSRALIGRPDSSWSHIEGAFVHRLQVLQVEDSSLQQTYTRCRQGTKYRTPFSLKWKGLEQQLLHPTNIFSNPGRDHVLGKLFVCIPIISIRGAVECKHFMEAYEQVGNGQSCST